MLLAAVMLATGLHGIVLPSRAAIGSEKYGKAAIFVADAGADALLGFPATGGSPTFVASAGLSSPQGLASSETNVYLANTGDSQVLVYAPPATSPALTIDDSGEYPVGVSATPDGGQIWVANICRLPSCGPGNLVEFSAGGGVVQTIECGTLDHYYNVAVDGVGDVVVDGTNASGSSEGYYIKAGLKVCKPLPANVNVSGSLQFTDKGDLTVPNQNGSGLTTYKAPSFKKVLYSTPFNGNGSTTFAFYGKHDEAVWTVSAGTVSVAGYAFPAGGSPLETIGGFAEPIGITTLPAPPVGGKAG